MRWGYIIPRVVLLAGIWAYFTYGFDPTLRFAAVYSAQKAVGAKVEIGAVKTGASPLGIQISNVQVANRNAPGTNLIEFESLVLDVNAAGFSRRALIVDDGELTGLQWGTPRQDSGLLPGSPEPGAAKDAADAASTDAPSGKAADMEARGQALFGGLTANAKTALDPNQFESVRMGPDLEKKWEANFSQLETQAQELKAEIDDIQKLAQSKSGNELQKIEAYRKAAAESKDALQKIKQLRDEVAAEKQQSRDDFLAFNAARDRDLAKIREKADLFQSDPQQIADFLLGPELNNRMNEIIDWTKWAKTNFHHATHDPAPERIRGEEIVFVHPAQLPKFLIKTLKISGKGQLHELPLEFTGTLTGLTSNPVLYGQPAVLQMNAEGPANVDLKVVFDYTQLDVEPSHELLLSYEAGNAPPLKLGDEKSLAVTVAADKLSCRVQLKLVGESLTGSLHFEEQPAKLTAALGGGASGIPKQVGAAISDIFAGIQGLQGDVQVSGTLESPKFALQSNIGQQVAGGMHAALSHQLDQGRDELEAKLNDQVAQQTNQLKDLFRTKSQSLTSQLNLNEQQVTQLMQQFTGGKLAGLDALKGSGDPSKPVDVKKAGAEIQSDLKKFFR